MQGLFDNHVRIIVAKKYSGDQFSFTKGLLAFYQRRSTLVCKCIFLLFSLQYPRGIALKIIDIM